MNKRIAVLCIAVLLVATLCYAQGAREPAYPTNTQSNTTNLGTTGLNTAGNPGYIMLKGVGQNGWKKATPGTQFNPGTTTAGNSNFVLWVDSQNDLCMASVTTISAYASYPTGSWDERGGIDSVCTKVGGQS